MNLNPGEPFPIVRVLERHTDSNTYFVRAVVRRQSGTSISTIETVDLTDQGNRIFSKVIQAPTDASATGLYIFVTSSVYTDAAYTTKSPNYGDQTVTYLVSQRWNMAFGGGGGGGISDRRLREVIREEFEKLLIDLAPLHSHLSRIEKLVRDIPDIEIPEPESLDPIRIALVGLRRVIENIPKPDIVDFSPLSSQFQTVSETLISELAMIRAAIPQISSEQRIAVEKKLTSLEEVIGKTPFHVLLHNSASEKPKRRLLI